MQVEAALIDNSFLPLVLDFRDVLKKINDDEFENFCRHNPYVEIELTREGELIITPPTGGETGIPENPESVSGEPLLKNFYLKMNKIWS